MCIARGLLSILLAVAMSGCGAQDAKDEVKPAGATPCVSAPSGYHFLKADSLTSEKLEEAREALPYDEIQLERTECYGDCPSYIVTFRRDGSATFVGRAHVENIGKFSGSLSAFNFGKLCWAIEKFKLTQLEPKRFVSDTVDHPTATLRINGRQPGSRTEIVEDGRPGPIELWVVQNSIDRLAGEVRWKAAQESLIRKPNADTLIDDVAKITLETPDSSALKEHIRVSISDAETCTRFMNAINGLAIEGDGVPMNQAADMRALDVELLIQDHSGHEHSMGFYWGQSDGGTVVYESSVYRVTAGLTALRKLIANNSGLPEFGGLRPDDQAPE